MFKINIITQLLIFFVMAISINFLHLYVLIGLFIFVLILLVTIKNDRFLYAMLRFKWFFLVMLLIFVFTTPGEHLAQWPFSISPTYEGVVAGATQVLRIMLMLAGLSLILASNTRQQLISGFYFIFSPLKNLGLKVERFAARLWLTLHYVERQDKLPSNSSIIAQLHNMTMLNTQQPHDEVSVSLTLQKFNFADYAVITLLVILVLLRILRVF